MKALLKEELEVLSKAGLDALSKEELRELRRRIMTALPEEHVIARMSGTRGMPQEEYDKFVLTQLELYKAELYKATQEPAVQTAG